MRPLKYKMSDLSKAVKAFKEINSLVVGDKEKGLVFRRFCSRYYLPLSDALAAMEKGESAMIDAMKEKAIWVGKDVV
jgi:hypothetical protein